MRGLRHPKLALKVPHPRAPRPPRVQGGPSDLAAALKGARPRKSSRIATIKSKLFGR